MNVLPKLSVRERAYQARLLNPLVLSSLISEAADLMREASTNILQPNFGKVSAEQKLEFGKIEPVTVVDRKISKFLLEAVQRSLPGSYSEEDLPSSTERRRENLLWQFDPLDGTQEYIDGFYEGVAIQGSLLAKIDGHYLPVTGLIYRPATKTLWYLDETGRLRCEIDGKAQLPPQLRRGKVLRGCMRRVDPDPALADYYRTLAKEFDEATEIISCGGAGASFADILDGTANIFINNQDRSKSWDIAMAIPLIEARGGFICDLRGNSFDDLNAEDLRSLEGFVSSVVYRKEEVLPLLPPNLLRRS